MVKLHYKFGQTYKGMEVYDNLVITVGKRGLSMPLGWYGFLKRKKIIIDPADGLLRYLAVDDMTDVIFGLAVVFGKFLDGDKNANLGLENGRDGVNVADGHSTLANLEGKKVQRLRKRFSDKIFFHNFFLVFN